MFFSQLLPSFCQTASPGFDYHFYLAYDKNDLFYSKQDGREKFRTVFEKADCAARRRFNVTLHFVRCSHDGRPAWAQNDAMMEAYLDDMDYYYRINDDTKMATTNWTWKLINALRQYDPPNLGVVGPTFDKGNRAILTYDFVHKTHVDLFGYYYPREFTDWFADGWITAVYDQVKRKRKLHGLMVAHTKSGGTRYKVHKTRHKLPALLKGGLQLFNR